jgi:hypothetical protein
MIKKATPLESVTVRPSLKFYKDVDPGLYSTLTLLPEQIRGEFIHSMLTRSAVGVATPLQPLPDTRLVPAAFQVAPTIISGRDRPSEAAIENETPEARSLPSINSALSATKSPSRETERTKVEESYGLSNAPASSTPRGLDAIWGDVGDAFDYSKPHT